MFTPPGIDTRWLRHARGLTLIETCLVLAVSAILVALAWPSQQAQLQRARRLDGIAALTALQLAQERHRARHGSYSADLAGVGSASSAEGYYRLSVANASSDRVTLRAQARADGAQGSDEACAELTLRLDQGLADIGPSARCWNR